MNLNYNSFSATPGRWFFKGVLMWILLVSSVILSFPALIISKFKDSPGDPKVVITGVGYWIILYFIICILGRISLIWVPLGKEGLLYTLNFSRIVLSITGFSFGLAYLIVYIQKKLGERSKEKSTFIIKEFVKAKINDSCPKDNVNMKHLIILLEVLSLAIENDNNDAPGLCYLIRRLKYDEVISEREKMLLYNFIREHRPDYTLWSSLINSVLPKSSIYYWKPNKKGPRIRWLKKQIKILKTQNL